MPYLLDSDAAKKLCQYGLIEELAAALGIPISQFAVLPQLKYQLHANNVDRSAKKLGSAAAVDHLRLLLSHAIEIEIGPRGADLIVCLDRPDIQSGEQVLFAALIENDGAELLTGDKKALAALSALKDPLIPVTLWARIICLEEALLILVEKGSFEALSVKIRACPEVDTSISIVFGRSTASTRSQVLEGLNSYLGDLQRRTGGAYQFGES